MEAALRAGKHVATANKELMAKHGHDLCQIADDNGVALRYEGSVAGAFRSSGLSEPHSRRTASSVFWGSSTGQRTTSSLA